MEEQLIQWVGEKLSEDGWGDCFLIDVEVQERKVAVFLDSDEGISFERCQRMSRYLEAYLDEVQYMDGRYNLVVSSPGVDRPLTLLRQYAKNLGRDIRWTLKDGREFVAGFKTLNGQVIGLERPHPERKNETLEEEIDFNDIEKAVVQISFKKRKK